MSDAATPPPAGPLSEDAFRALCLRYHAGEIDARGFEELCAELDASDERRAVFVETAMQAEAMHQVYDHAAAEQTAAELGIADDDEFDIMSEVVASALAERRKHELEDEANRQLAAQLAEDARNRRFELRRNAAPEPVKRVVVMPKAVVWLGAAAVLGLLATVITLLNPSTPSNTPSRADSERTPTSRSTAPPVLATLVYSLDARWADDADAWSGRLGLRQGEHRLAEGLVEIELADGVRVVLEAPVAFTLTGTNAMELAQGRLVAHVPPSGYGFSVDTPTARIVDYGTEFGVETDGYRATQVHVFRGEVRAASRVEGVVVGEPRPVMAQQAAVIDAGGASITLVDFDEASFERRVAKRLDLADMIVGGDGTTGRRDIGIHPLTGAIARGIGSAPNAMIMLGTGEARPVPGSPFVARVFIPSTHGSLSGLPAGLDLPGLPRTNGVGFGLLWCGEQLPAESPNPATPVTNNIVGYDFDGPDHQSLIMHANVGLVIDLDAIRDANPGMRIASVSAVIGNTAGQNPADPALPLRTEFLVLLDNDLVAHERFASTDPARRHAAELDIEIAQGQRYLTLVSADAGDQNHRDWLVVGDPIIFLEPIP
ncbi:FecR family protein [Phycisphaeraceae bacterium D3-23]